MTYHKRQVTQLAPSSSANKKTRIFKDINYERQQKSGNQTSTTRKGVLKKDDPSSKIQKARNKVKFCQDVSIETISSKDYPTNDPAALYWCQLDIDVFRFRNRCFRDSSYKLSGIMKLFTNRFVLGEQKRQKKDGECNPDRLRSASRVFGDEAMLMALQRGLDNASEVRNFDLLNNSKTRDQFDGCSMVVEVPKKNISLKVFRDSNQRYQTKVKRLMRRTSSSKANNMINQ